MPPKAKVTQRAKEASTSGPSVSPPQPPRTVNEQTRERYYLGRPYAKSIDKAGVSSLSPAERTSWATAQYLGASATSASRKRPVLSNKTQKELWRHANEASLPLRALKKAPPPDTTSGPPPSGPPSVWGRDRSGRDVGTYSLDDFRERTARRVRLTILGVSHCAFLAKRNTSSSDITPEDIQAEKQRRAEIAKLQMELYGQRTGGSYAQDPEWDDVEPVAIVEPEGALAAIAYPEAYGEAISYLRAVMAKPEYSPRCLRLTEFIISLNPAHYTVWLYRFSVVNALKLPVTGEIEWLNEVALQNLKNYQIWHHRYLLAELHYSQIADSPERVAAFARSEVDFLTMILAEDTKNYHVWSYRHYLVRKLAYWTADERIATEAFIRQDVRNNSAWSHRFFLVFSDPANSTPEDAASTGEDGDGLETSLGKLNIGHDPAVPEAIIEREIRYAKDSIHKAPQNESPWNYLKGVLSKGNRPLGSIEDFASQFVGKIGQGDEEVVKSTHAMDVLATIYGEKGDIPLADLYLERLANKWDPIRAGYWEYQREQLKHGAGKTA
ncbi:farnesyltransferase alpha subunit ram2 [Grosmannia clavigera kw1407]|uniref:Protein farnesyltransferase/geranylgeranyltransferase type-1 subunit alpha n=1 Tax=Grosmannia clavigera (strain kw1407 / UAMH 11150) TaxID=655863 RepID=F0XEC1_GROCL|nr:farnesyltransferase alpha subunit ram2 [Grosmannia clavigera kw1407]EFX04084.1 farnesyltransferase alpha subunit ram2 [Grosmannia clavigera kw1407]